MSKETQIRWLIRRDLPAVLEIDAVNDPDPWVEDRWIYHLRQRSMIGMVAETVDDEIVGTMLYELQRDCLRVIKFVVKRGCTGQGIGKLMLDKLMTKLYPGRRERLVFETTLDNQDGLAFLKYHGFLATGIDRDDNIDMTYTIREEELSEL